MLALLLHKGPEMEGQIQSPLFRKWRAEAQGPTESKRKSWILILGLSGRKSFLLCTKERGLLSKAGSEAGGNDGKLWFGDLSTLRINQM